MRSTTYLLLAVMYVAGCVNPPPPVPPRPPAPDRYQKIADQDPAVRGAATAELVFDPTPRRSRSIGNTSRSSSTTARRCSMRA